MTARDLVTIAAAASLGLAAGPLAAPAFAEGALGDRRVQVGDSIDDVELKTIDGKRDHLLAKGVVANVVVFFRPQQEHSLDTLKDFARCEQEFVGKPVRWVGVVSDSWSADEVKGVVKETGVKMPVLVDEGDAVYGKLGIRLHPVVAIVDAKRKLAAYEPFREINYCARIAIRVKVLLGEAKEEEIAKVDNPEKATTRTESGVARRHLNFARTLMRIGQNDKALAEVEKSLAVEPSAAAYELQGQLLAALGRCPDAIRAFDAALKIDPASTVAKDGRTTCGR